MGTVRYEPNADATFKSLTLGGNLFNANTVKGVVRRVDSVSGDDGYDGLSWKHAFKTIAAAVAASAAGDTIICSGSFSEAVTISLAGLRIVGATGNPADAVWTAPTVAGSFCAYVNAANVQISGFKFRPVIYTTSGIPSAIKLGAAPYAKISGNRFQGQAGSYAAIYSPAATCDNVEISDNEFIYMNTATYGYAIQCVAAGGLTYSNWQILRNVFNSCVNDILLPARCCILDGNRHCYYGISAAGVVGAVTTGATGAGINLSGTGSGGNIVCNCVLGAAAYTLANYTPGASSDAWMGNKAAITATTCAYGTTVLYPGA